MGEKNMSGSADQDRKKDQERVASMANEGGAAGAEMDTREQLETAARGRGKKRRRMPWMWGAAAASAAVGGVALARTVTGRNARRPAAIETETEIKAPKSRRTKGAKASRTTTPMQPRAERGTGSPKRRRGGNNANVRKAANRRGSRQGASAR